LENTLTISIPTNNRAEILRDNLSNILDLCKEYSININIYDDSTDQETRMMIDDLMRNYPFIHYLKNPHKLAFEKNYLQSLLSPKTDYVWVLGDSMTIETSLILNVLETINSGQYDLISVNVKGRNLSYPSKSYNDCREVFLMFGWHMTLIGATIYSRQAIASVDKHALLKIKNFPQIVLCFRYLAEKCSFFWMNETILVGIKRGHHSYWIKDFFAVFIEDWTNAVMSLSEIYSSDLCQRVIVRHSKLSGIFGLRTLASLRGLGIYNYKEYKKYREQLLMHSKLNRFILLLLSLFPPIIFVFIRKIFSTFTRKRLELGW